MATTYQFENINMLQHGEMVHDSYLKLLSNLNNNNFLEILNIVFNNQEKSWLLKNQYGIALVKNYHIYHDCGKPYCKIINEEGKQQFPQHAEISQQTYQDYFDNDIVSELIGLDMMFHTLKGDGLISWLVKNKNKDNTKMLATLYLTAWSELIANSEMFGGYDTVSFKIKKKALIKAGRKLFNQVNMVDLKLI